MTKEKELTTDMIIVDGCGGDYVAGTYVTLNDNGGLEVDCSPLEFNTDLENWPIDKKFTKGSRVTTDKGRVGVVELQKGAIVVIKYEDTNETDIFVDVCLDTVIGKELFT